MYHKQKGGPTWVLVSFGPSMLGYERLRFYLSWMIEICSTEIKSEPSIASMDGLDGANTHAIP